MGRPIKTLRSLVLEPIFTMVTLQNKTVLVVGGSSGIGFGIAFASLQSLAGLVIIASSNAERVSGAIERLRSHIHPGEIRGEVPDAKDTVAVKEFCARLGTVDHALWTSGDMPSMTDSPESIMEVSGCEMSRCTTYVLLPLDAFNVRFWGAVNSRPKPHI